MTETTDTKPKKAKTKRHVKRAEPMLTTRQAAYVHNIAMGMTKKQAALSAGYAPGGGVRSAVFENENNTRVRRELEKTYDKIRERVAWTAAEAFEETGRALAIAEKTRNATAMVRATELRSRLFGLLIERQQVEVATVDIKSALDAARARVVNLSLPAPKPANVLPACDLAQVEDAQVIDVKAALGAARNDGPSIPSRVTPHMMPNFNR